MTNAAAEDQILVREATEADVPQIREIFRIAYGDDYAFPQYFDVTHLKKLVFNDDCLMLVAVDKSSDDILGTGSVVYDVGAFADLVGEFGRLVVHPAGRGRGIASAIMRHRLARVSEHLHVGLADNRVAHEYSQRISIRNGFAPVGYLPIHNGEPVALFARYFNDSLKLRRNHPHVAPAVHWLADLTLRNAGLDCDAIADEAATAYSSETDFEVEELTAHGYARLLRFERGRLRHRDIFGPVKLHFGARALQRHHTHYLLAKRGSQLLGAIGYARDQNIDNAVRIFELIYLDERPVRFLLCELDRRCRKWQVDYMETDVSADSPRMQKTLLELGFLPVAYVPSAVFHNVERLDTIRMARYYIPLPNIETCLVEAMQPIADEVIDSFQRQWIEPTLAETLPQMPLFHGLNTEQTACLANRFRQTRFEPEQWITRQGGCEGDAYVILSGTARVVLGSGTSETLVERGDFLGELSLLNNAPHSAGVQAIESIDAAVINREDLNALLLSRGDIGCILYRNLAKGLGEKLRRINSPRA